MEKKVGYGKEWRQTKVGTNRQVGVGDEQTVGTNKYGGNERTGIVDLSKAVGKHSLGAHRAPNL